MSNPARASFLAAYATIHARGQEMLELVAADVAYSRILALYPLEMPELPALVRAHLNSPERTRHFVRTIQEVNDEGLYQLFEALSVRNFTQLNRQEKLLFSKYASFNDLADDIRAECGATSYSQVIDVLRFVASVLWMGANFPLLPELRELEESLSRRLEAINEALRFASAMV